MLGNTKNQKHQSLCFILGPAAIITSMFFLPPVLSLGMAAVFALTVLFFNTNIFKNITLLHLAGLLGFVVLATLLPVEEAFATKPVGTLKGFGKVAFDVYTALDGYLGLSIGLLGGGIAIASMIKGMNSLGIASGMGIALGSGIAPDLVIALNGGMLI